MNITVVVNKNTRENVFLNYMIYMLNMKFQVNIIYNAMLLSKVSI